MKTDEFWHNRLIFKAYSGSRSHGTQTPPNWNDIYVKGSDVDTRGICIEPQEYLLGLRKFEQFENEIDDETIFSLRKFVKLALANNPNIMDTLFAVDEDVIFINEFGRELRDIREQFLSKLVFITFGSYASDQLKKMTTVDKNATGNRKKSIERYGYDSKNALHTFRLMEEGIEILEGQGVLVRRPNFEFLLRVKAGEFSLAEINETFEILNEKLRAAYLNSKLPEQPDYDSIHKWLVDVTKRSLDWDGNKTAY